MSDSDRPTQENHAMIVAAGQGERSGLGLPKQFAYVEGKPMVRHSAACFLSHPDITKLWMVIGEGQESQLADALDGLPDYEVMFGGATRQDSVRHGLRAIAAAGGAKNILIHDAARPFLSHDMIDRLLVALEKDTAAMPVLPTIDTTIRVTDRHMKDIVDRDSIWRVQTPQAFDFDKLMNAHASWTESHDASDDTQIFKAAGHQVAVVKGDESLKKYTTASDFAESPEQYTGRQNMMQIRTGMGYDVHQLAAGEELWLGGLKIDHDKGLAGHSDADVLLHALTDALLGAAGAGDIGDHFPPSDPQWRGASSDKFVSFAASVIKQKGGSINNVDMTVICEAPKIKPHREAMRENIAKLLDISVSRVSVKATTTEKLGFTGRGEGIAAQAVATISMELE